MAKTYILKPTKNKDLDRVVDREGNWDHYFHRPSGRYLRATSFILRTGYAKGPRFYDYLKNNTKEEIEAKLQAAGERGTKVHNAIDLILGSKSPVKVNREILVPDPKTNQSVRLANDEWDRLLSWNVFWERHAPILVAGEESVFSLKAGYAGTLDAIIIITKECGNRYCACKGLVGKLLLIDWKTSGGFWNEYGAQVSSYAFSDNISSLIGKRSIEYTAILRLGADKVSTGGYDLQVYDKKQTNIHWREFMAAMLIANADYKSFDPVRDIQEIPDNFKVIVSKEIRKKVGSKKRKKTVVSKKVKKLKKQIKLL